MTNHGPSCRHLNPFTTGFWLAGNLYDFYEASEDMPSWARLAWNTRKCWQLELKSYCSEATRNTFPCVESRLRSVDVVPWIGRQFTVWCVEISIRLLIHGQPSTFEQRRSFANYDQARLFFEENRQDVHRALTSTWGLSFGRATQTNQ